MRKLLSVTLVAVLLLCTFTFFNGAHAASEVRGLISSDTTWSQASSPYILTGPVGVLSGVTLTIEPGVTVEISTYFIQVNGTLKAQGTSSNNILFTTSNYNYNTQNSQNVIQFFAGSTSWNDQTTSGCVIENAIFNSTDLSTQGCSPRISRNTFNNSRVTLSGGSPSFLYNIIYPRGAGTVISAMGSPNISNNYIKGTGYEDGITAGDNSYVADNVFDHCWGGARLNGQVTFKGNTVSNCYDVGISMYSRDPSNPESSIKATGNYISNNRGAGITGYGIIESNTIVNNQVGIQLSSLATVTNNNIYGNTKNNLALTSTANIDASNNYWGTTDSEAISQTILDSRSDFTLGTVTYTPFLTQPNSNAPTKPLLPVSTPTPPPNSQQATTPPSNNPTRTPQPTPPSDWLSAIGSSSKGPNNPLEATILEVAQVVLVVLGLAWGLIVLVFVNRRRKRNRKVQ